MTWPFTSLWPISYGLIVADPPWNFKHRSVKGQKKSAQAHYHCMCIEDIMRLPVKDLAMKDCYLALWVTHPMLREGLATLDAWGFKFVTSGVWSKRGTSGKLAFGPGYVLRTCSEPFLIGRIGNPKTASKSIRTVIEAPRREHSRKPEESYAAFRKLFGETTRADLFTRETRPGFDGWGNEKEKFDEKHGAPVAAPASDAAPAQSTRP